MAKTYTVYDNMEFPDYNFMEFPKHVYPNGPDQPYVQVNSPEEEAEAMKNGRVVREDDEHARLVEVATVKGVKIDRRWKNERLREAIADAGHDPDLDPKA